jgi:hypothetical protein
MENIDPGLLELESTELLVPAIITIPVSNVSDIKEEVMLIPTSGVSTKRRQSPNATPWSLVPESLGYDLTNESTVVGPSNSAPALTSPSPDLVETSRNNFDIKAHFAERERLLALEKERKRMEKLERKRVKEIRKREKERAIT